MKISRGRHAALGVLGLTLVLAVPLVVALVALREPRWFPLTDMAQYELFVRDVPSAHPPDLGLPGRIYGWGARGSHPGPIGFFILSPLYELAGSDGWSLQVSTGGLVLAASAVAIWMGYRRGGWAFAVAVTAMLALLMRGYGMTILLETWNPHLPIFWWVAFLLAVWGVLCRDTRLLPVVVFTGSVCTQTHISYIPLVGGLSLLAAAVVTARGVRAYRAQRAGVAGARGRLGHLLAWSGGSVALLGALWLLPLVEHVTHTPGNLSVIRKNFTTPVDDRLGFGDAIRLWLDHLDVRAILHRELKAPFPYQGIPVNLVALGFLGVWAAAAVLAWRRRDVAVRRLHLVVGLAILLGLVGASRIIGPPWPYLTYWAWGTSAVMVLATVWTFLPTRALEVRDAEGQTPTTPENEGEDVGEDATEAGDETGAPGEEPVVTSGEPLVVDQPRWLRPSLGVLGAVTLLAVAAFALDAPDAEMGEAPRSAALAEVVGPTVDRLAQGSDGCDDDCRLLVTWTDETTHGLQTLGLVAALEREGFDARVLSPLETMVGSHRVARRSEVDLEVHLAVDESAIARWRRRDGAELVASYRPGPYDPAEPVAIFLVPLDRPTADAGPRDDDA